MSQWVREGTVGRCGVVGIDLGELQKKLNEWSSGMIRKAEIRDVSEWVRYTWTEDSWCESSSQCGMGHHGHSHWPHTHARSIDPIKATPLCFCSSLSLWLLSCLTVLILMRSTTLHLSLPLSIVASVCMHQFMSSCLTLSLHCCLPILASV